MRISSRRHPSSIALSTASKLSPRSLCSQGFFSTLHRQVVAGICNEIWDRCRISIILELRRSNSARCADEAGDDDERAVAIAPRDREASTSDIQRRLSVGDDKAASLIERMEKEGVVSAPGHSGKRDILVGGGGDRAAFDPGDDD